MKATNWRLLVVVVKWHHRANCNLFSFSTRISNSACALSDSRWHDVGEKRLQDRKIESKPYTEMQSSRDEKRNIPPPQTPPTKQREFTSAIIWSYFNFYWSIWLFSLQGRVCHYACNDDYSNDISLDCRSLGARMWLNVLKVLKRQNCWHSR